MADPATPPHAVFLPYPAQGHITPMLRFAKLLHSRGSSITFVLTHYNRRRLLRSRGAAALDAPPGFRYASFPDGLPESDSDVTQDIPALCYSTITNCLLPFKALVEELLRSGEEPPPTCLVVDATMSFGLDAAKELGLRSVVFWTASACGFMGYYYYQELIDRGLVPLKDESQLTDGYLETPLESWAAGLTAGVRLRDIPTFIRTTDRGDIMLNFWLFQMARAKLPSAWIINTFDEFERGALDAMAKLLPPIYTVGPLHMLGGDAAAAGGTTTGSSLWAEQADCLPWLRGKPPRSVVYVNYGSITVMSGEQLLEFAWGLAGCGYDFLWVLRPDVVDGGGAVLPPEFLAATAGRGFMASWCAQEEVLASPAVGVFLTHSGWNSTLDAVCNGVPMLSWPFFAEQQMNCFYKEKVWGIGMEIGGDVRREEVAAMIKEAMEGEKGKEMRRRAAEWKEKAAAAATPGGSSAVNLEAVVNQVLMSKKV